MIGRLSALLILLGASSVSAQDVTVNIGVREDATSMSYLATDALQTRRDTLPGPLSSKGYAGYMVFVCDRALIALQRHYGRDLTINVTPVKAFEVFEALETNEIDIICGPTTATRDRLQGRISSSPLFLSGVTFASRPLSQRQDCQSLIGYLRSSTAGSGNIAKIIESDEWPQDKRVLSSFLAGENDWQQSYVDCDPEVMPIREYETHMELAAAFCGDEIRHYIGDMEIITRTLQAYKATETTECLYNLSGSTFSEERYVILGNARSQDGEENAIVAHFFEVLSRQVFFQPSVLDDAFEATFPLAQKSRKLDLLFWAIRGNTE